MLKHFEQVYNALERAYRRSLRFVLRRKRAIFGISVATTALTIALFIGNGAGGEARRPLGIAVVGGLLLSQILTLFITPVIYLSLHRVRARFGWSYARDAAAENLQATIHG